MVALYDQILLFGDSITEFGDCQFRGFGFAAAVRDAYIRRLDVVNRGLSGYNTKMALKVMDQIIPKPTEAKVRLMTVFFGANDACFPRDRLNQCVPLPQYAENLMKILSAPSVKAHSPMFIIITPPPINEYMTFISEQAKGFTTRQRTAENTKAYADTARAVGKEMDVPVLDLWGAIMKLAGWKPGKPLPGSSSIERNPILDEMLFDGLHLSPLGYRVLYDEFMKLVREEWPDQAPDALPYILPRWDDETKWDAMEG